MLQNKITILNNAKSQAISIGDIDQVNTIEKELLDTQNTFSQLAMLQDMTQTATNANMTPMGLMATGLDSIQNVPPTIQGPSASAIINGYDISAYATDPLHEQKIQNIINAMPAMVSATDVDIYIQSIDIASPITGDMVMPAVEQYNVDLFLLLAIMQNDSNFGTLGVGARTNNPGNVGNNGISERSYPSWGEGVLAVAEWLDNHRV
jgi:hypothetical protein